MRFRDNRDTVTSETRLASIATGVIAGVFAFAANTIFFVAVVASPVWWSPETLQSQIDGDNIAPKASIYPKPRP